MGIKSTDNRGDKKRKSKNTVIISIVGIFLALVFSAGFYGYKLYSNVEQVKITDEELGLTTKPVEGSEEEIELKESEEKESEVNYGTFRQGDRFINIALMGVDARSLKDDTGTRADCIMVLSIDRENKSMKLGSIARDTYANIEGYGMDKINHAYAFGGPALMVKTLNQNFDLNISNFVVVNFFGMEKIIDRLGGVEIEVDEEEIQYINSYINEIKNIEGVSCDGITTPGIYNLNGIQAVAYSRIRYTSGGDFKRTERQREVLLKLAGKSSSIKLTDVMPIINELSSNLKTTLSASDMLSIATEIIKGGYQRNMEEKMFPEAEYSGGDMINGIYYYVTDLEQAKARIHEYLFGE
ncbi:LCP family protein [Clostridium sp.]|uniref:LCP family protein n=1 Tax=Clostridium sp. TaxID=1506 RepID=UPI003216EFAA